MAERRSKAKTATTLGERIDPRLKPLDAARARSWFDDFTAAADEAGVDLGVLKDDRKLAAFVSAVMDHSRFLRMLMIDNPARLVRLLEADPEALLRETCDAAETSWRLADRDETIAVLRRSRAEIALLVALADLGGVWSIDRAMAALSQFADAAIMAAAARALVDEHERGAIRLPDPDDPQQGSGWILLAMGKLGAGELNYSSDVDLISLFEPAVGVVPDGAEPTKLYVRLTQSLIAILQEHTDDGYVLRTDLRLRPDPGSTAAAVSVPAALIYYEAHGQNWERAAMIKARAVAGDLAAGEAFLDELSPFLWRKYLDYAAIADIHSIKRQIHDHRGHATIAIAGHNLKLGRGGIREIEFFVQTQQLIAGGRNPALRGRRTLDMLAELAKEHWVDEKAAADLTEAYRLLRQIEHRLQMIDDQQTHTLPKDADGLRSIALLSGAKDEASFEKLLRPSLECTQGHYAHLFEEAPSLSAAIGNLVFTGDEDDPETLETLTTMGFRDPQQISGIIRGWHYGRYPATRSTAARERLTEITPALLAALAEDNGDAAVVAFDRFIARLPAGVQLFSLLGSNPWMLSLFSGILGVAPRLADIITRRPHALDAIIEPAFFGGLPDCDFLAVRLKQTMEQANSFEDSLDRIRIFGQEQSLLIGARIIAGAIAPRDAAAAYTDLADLLIGEALRLAHEAVEAAHGKMPGSKIALLALGKLGGREMTAASDLDLILLYDFSKKATGSDGARPLTGGQYFIRLTQRLVSVLSAPTAEGSLYEVDFRLRPSGNAGPLATSIDGFAEYQKNEAWTWEHMALTRARVIAGERGIGRAASEAITGILQAKRDPKKLRADILEMRALIESEKGSENPWDIKQARGGLVDIEFIAQYLQLRHGNANPEIVNVETERSLIASAERGYLSKPQAERLLSALRLYQSLVQIIRLCVEEPFEPGDASAGLKALLARAGEAPDFIRLEQDLTTTQAEVRALFEDIVGPLAAD